MKTCPICQQGYSDEIEFCARDGARLTGEVRDERECPYCAERILKKARVCKHCGRDVEPMIASTGAAEAPAAPVKTVQPPAVEPRAQPPAIPSIITPSPRPAREKPPAFEIISEQRSRMRMVKSFTIALGTLLLAVIVILYFSQHRVKKGQVTVNPNDGLKYVWVLPGTFTMGCSTGDTACTDFEKPPHQVTLSKGFWLGQTEVTAGAFKRFCGPSEKAMPPEPTVAGRRLNPGWSNDSMPVVGVTWDDAQAYCKWAGGRLPTEAEWEYAARAGSSAARYDDAGEIAWYADNSGDQHLDSSHAARQDDPAGLMKALGENGDTMHETGKKQANALGLFDMLGNVWEWVADAWDPTYYQNSPAQNPAGTSSGQLRVVRGGSWASVPSDLRVSVRNGRNPANRDSDLGFRCAVDATTSQ